ncbi:short-chain dehydrogenase [Paenibacillus sp. VTT E-133280]|jgi:NAD(P)-dependent dehydrogenase (short-subunit alcohol dehydrogenase family)|uniref:SDR family oxidoreductase n=1 Tax=unclassified Paenibacillus TaxID=185978 RepID=UPI000B9FD6A4|nr:SDR family oxidoreductase [Paenibacillus sp. VTT E-133280]OZQ67264.1 short-chain dehydrogenase [Paenibacillus sp. VTT E-133280]
MRGKIALVTGANSGMGLATTVELARKGAKVIMVCRNRQRGEEALAAAKQKSHSEDIELMFCDLASLESIRSFAEEFTRKYPILDILINNAGVVTIKRQLTKDGFEMDLGVNHLGHFLLTNLLLEPLKAAEQGRIVVVASGAYKIGALHYEDPTLARRFNPAKAYARSKLANILFTKELAARLQGTRVTVNCVHPGAVGTNIGVNRETGFGKSILKLLSYFFLTPEQGADTAIYLATEPDLQEVTGQYYYRRKIKQLSPRAQNRQEAERLWLWSQEQVGLSN